MKVAGRVREGEEDGASGEGERDREPLTGLKDVINEMAGGRRDLEGA